MLPTKHIIALMKCGYLVWTSCQRDNIYDTNATAPQTPN